MNSKQVTILILIVAYIIIIGGLTIHHAFHFSSYVHRKGDETINYTESLLLTSILFQGLVWLITKTFNWKAAMLGTFANFILSFIIGFGILSFSELSGTPKHLILIYGSCFITIFTIVVLIQLKTIHEHSNPKS